MIRPQQRGAFLSLNTAVQQLAAGLAAYGAGLLVTTTADGQLLHYKWVGYAAAASAVLCLFVVRRVVGAASKPPIKAVLPLKAAPAA